MRIATHPSRSPLIITQGATYRRSLIIARIPWQCRNHIQQKLIRVLSPIEQTAAGINLIFIRLHTAPYFFTRHGASAAQSSRRRICGPFERRKR
jgi:hypothetical protein